MHPSTLVCPRLPKQYQCPFVEGMVFVDSGPFWREENATVKTKEVLHSSFHLNFMSGKLLLDPGENKGETHHGETTITCFFVGKKTRVMTDPVSSFLDGEGTTIVLYTYHKIFQLVRVSTMVVYY